jgi:EAL domain-containing protein (putative c-di-GMP-specific phosphodiesterase class I)
VAKDKKISLEEIAKALAHGDFVFFYQPIISLLSGKVYGVEALIRWLHPDGSVIPASLFIPLAEETGFITEITQAMLPKLMADITAIHQSDPLLTVAFNVSAHDLAARDSVDNILRAIQEHQIDPQKFRVEITETQILIPNAEIQKAIIALDTAGVQIVIDDFGSGYSSIALIRDLPVSNLKIDQGFVSRIFESEKNAQIVRHTISLAHQLEISSTGEGVETQDVFDFLLCFGCDCAQGYYFSMPLSLSNFLEFLSQEHRWTTPPIGFIHLALQDHIDWRRDFVREMLSLITLQDEKLKQKTYERMPNLDPQKCLLGKWYDGAVQEYRGKATFDQIGIEHGKLHQTANRLVESTRAGASKEQIVRLIWSLNKHSDKLQGLLQDFHTDIALRYKKLA